MRPAADPRAFIRENLRLLPAPSAPDILLYTAHAGSGLHRLLGDEAAPPYWAYRWAGGSVLARYILDRPEIVAGRRVIDLGTGSGIVGIVAAKCGAADVTAIDVDPLAIVAAELNAEANGVAIHTTCEDILDGPPPPAEVILCGDVFYDAALAARMLPFLERCLGHGLVVLVGDPGRSPLPRADLKLLTEYPVSDFGDAADKPEQIAGVYGLAAPAGQVHTFTS